MLVDFFFRYANGPQLFICYPGEIPVRTVESASTWMQTD